MSCALYSSVIMGVEMMYMLRNESRNLLMQAFEKNHNVIQMLPVLE